ncbi:TonB-dependent receptor [Mucilaginibacter sp. cycad4]|uniref:TonB-dependent receptor n=1 Tax=Mucilaginibacter sp. cycad4 TaxID=3342096 RepID=UPI002AAAD130|nr:TonB-dependent receptor [Mucilaginibacter gossypii]WPU98426.1 TonB-dependent receptor [Mucilaginibacter gossypii]
MKLTFFLVLVAFIHVNAASLAQGITLNKTNATLRETLDDIRKQSGMSLLCDAELINNSEYVNVKIKNATLDQALQKTLTGQPFSYRIKNNTIIIFVKDEPAEEKKIIKVSGKVTDIHNQPLPGVTVKLKGAQQAVATDINGVYSINVPDENAVLVFSFVGFSTQEVAVQNKTILNVTLIEENSKLNEVVVVGYGTQKKVDVTTAISSVNSTQIARAATGDPTGALQGTVPGANVEKTVGKPGSGYSVTIRGVHSIGSSNEPLYVIDGIPTTGGLNDLNPADIEKIDILKDASAASIYGSRGAKGVVIVTTKHGKAGRTTLTFDSYVGEKRPVHLPDMMNSQQYVDYRIAQAQGSGKSTELADILSSDLIANYNSGINTDWPDLVLKNAVQMNHNITASGGDEKTRFSMSAGYLFEDGNVTPENYKKYNLRGNVDRQITDQWKAGINLYLVQDLTNLGSYETLRSSYRLPPITNPYDASGAPQFRVFNNDAVTNPLFDETNDLRQNRSLRSFGNLYVQFQPIKDFIIKSTISPSYVGGRSGTYYGPQSKQSVGGSQPTTGSYSTSDNFTWVWDNQAIYDRQFGAHHLTATVIQSMQKDRSETSTLTVAGLPYASLWYNLGTGGTVQGYGTNYTLYSLASFTGRVNYNFKDKYLLTATGRYDGSSHLAEGHQWGFFPSASAAWRISQEDFMKKLTSVNDLKLRLSYGSTGNDRISAYSTQATLGQTFYDFGGTLANGYAPNQLANQNLTWETTKELNLGVDYSLFNNRVSGSVDIYTRKILNILQNRQLPPETGFNSVASNVGQMKNQGIEVALNTINIQAKRFQWKTEFTFEASKNEITQLYGGTKNDVGNVLFIGQPVSVNYDYVFDGIWQTDQAAQAAKYNQKPGQIRVKDLDGNGAINASDKAILGQRTPKWTGSIANTFRYGPLDLYVLVYTRQGEQFNSSFDATFMNYNQVYNQINEPYWTPANPSSKWWQPGNPGPYTTAPLYRSTNFVRINNITLGYTFPSSILQKIKVNSLRVYATATNPVLFTKYNGFDPEWAAQNTFGTAISTAVYLVGVNLSF